jgi:hypothetical protein
MTCHAIRIADTISSNGVLEQEKSVCESQDVSVSKTRIGYDIGVCTPGIALLTGVSVCVNPPLEGIETITHHEI